MTTRKQATNGNKPAVPATGAAPAAPAAAPVAVPVADTEEQKEQQPEPPTDAELKAAKEKMDLMPTHCAYETPSPTKDDPYPLRTHCVWDEKLTLQQVALGYELPWKVCSSKGCEITFHGPCCATASVSHGLTGVTYDTDEMFCPDHTAELVKAHKKEQIMLKHMTLQRTEHLQRLANAESQGGTDEQALLQQTKLRVLGLISDLQLQCVCSSVPVNEGGFAQRNVASQQASQVEQLMRENGYNILAGNLAVVEIPYTEAEVKDLIDAKLIDQDFVPPKRLVVRRSEERERWVLDD